jgi:hypothetical protein
LFGSSGEKSVYQLNDVRKDVREKEVVFLRDDGDIASENLDQFSERRSAGTAYSWPIRFLPL